MLLKRNLIFAVEIGNRKSGAQLRLRIRVPAVHTTRIAGGSFFYSMENQKSLSVVDHENRPRISGHHKKYEALPSRAQFGY